jgi:hypothetical protein
MLNKEELKFAVELAKKELFRTEECLAEMLEMQRLNPNQPLMNFSINIKHFEERSGWIKRFVSLAEDLLSVEGFPKEEGKQDAHGCSGDGLCLLCHEVEAYNKARNACFLAHVAEVGEKDEEIAELKKSLEIRFGCWLCPKCHTAAPSGHLCTRCLESELSALKSQGKMTVGEKDEEIAELRIKIEDRRISKIPDALLRSENESLKHELARIRLGMGDDYGDDPVAVIKALKKEVELLKQSPPEARKVTVEEISRIIYSIIHKSGPDGDVVGEIAQAVYDRLEGRK